MAILGAAAGRTVRRWDRRGAVASALAAGLLLLAAPAARALDQSAGEYEVKAAFLYNFAKFVEWPESAFTDPRAGLTVCVAGEDPFGDILDRTVLGKTVATRQLDLRRLREPTDARLCHLLFLGRMSAPRARAMLAEVAALPVLTISDGADPSQPAVIAFRVEAAHVRFAIDTDAAARAGLRVSSRLLSVASRVTGGHGSR